MQRFLFFLIFVPILGYGQEIISGYLTDKENHPIENAKVFFENVTPLKTISNEQGYFEINYGGFEIEGRKLIIFKEGYKFVTLSSKKLQSQMVITLEPVDSVEEKVEKPIYENDVVELDEGLIYNSFAIDSIKKINTILDKIQEKFITNYSSSQTSYAIEGFHSLTEIRSEDEEDTLLYLKSPLFLELTSHADPLIHLNSNIGIQPVSTLFVKNPRYHVPQESPFFLYDQFTWINFLQKDFLTKRKNYQYQIMSEDDQSYQISFQIKKIQMDSWSGNFTVDKTNFAITRLEANLEFNRKNSFTIVSKNQTKNATSIIYFEGAKIIWEFAKPDFGFYQIKNLRADYRILHIGVDPTFTPQFLVKTRFEFHKSTLPADIKILPLNELLFRAFMKNYADE